MYVEDRLLGQLRLTARSNRLTNSVRTKIAACFVPEFTLLISEPFLSFYAAAIEKKTKKKKKKRRRRK